MSGLVLKYLHNFFTVVLSEIGHKVDQPSSHALSNLGYGYTCEVLRGVELFGEPSKSTADKFHAQVGYAGTGL